MTLGPLLDNVGVLPYDCHPSFLYHAPDGLSSDNVASVQPIMIPLQLPEHLP
jgi:hypothetical protein